MKATFNSSFMEAVLVSIYGDCSTHVSCNLARFELDAVLRTDVK